MYLHKCINIIIICVWQRYLLRYRSLTIITVLWWSGWLQLKMSFYIIFRTLLTTMDKNNQQCQAHSYMRDRSLRMAWMESCRRSIWSVLSSPLSPINLFYRSACLFTTLSCLAFPCLAFPCFGRLWSISRSNSWDISRSVSSRGWWLTWLSWVTWLRVCGWRSLSLCKGIDFNTIKVSDSSRCKIF